MDTRELVDEKAKIDEWRGYCQRPKKLNGSTQEEPVSTQRERSQGDEKNCIQGKAIKVKCTLERRDTL